MQLSDRTLVRLAWGTFSVLILGLIVGLPFLFVERATSAQTWGAGGLVSDLAFSLVTVSFPLVGLLIVRRQPRNTVGWVMLGIGLVFGLSYLADDYAVYGLLVKPGSVPGADVAAALNEGSWAPGIGLMGTFLVLLYPDGHLPSPRWRPLAWLCGVTIAVVTIAVDFLPGKLEESPVPSMENPIAWHWAEPVLGPLFLVFLSLFPLCILACAVGLVRRFRRSVGVERLQLRWLATAGAGVAALFLAAMVSVLLVDGLWVSLQGAPWIRALQVASTLGFGLLPAAIGIAILRHGLYEIDSVINRAMVYATLTGTLVAVYLACVLLLSRLLSPITEQSDLAVAGSTLAVAGLFGPVRARIQRVVDRRFYRNRYNAGVILDAFSDRLRHQVDLDEIGDDLRTAVQESVQPAYVSLWIRA